MTQNSNVPRSQEDYIIQVSEEIEGRIAKKLSQQSLAAPVVHSQESREKTALPVNRNSAVKTPLRPSKQTKIFWPFSSWQRTTNLQISITILTEFPNCQSHSRQRCPRSSENLKSSSCLKIFSKRASKSIIS